MKNLLTVSVIVPCLADDLKEMHCSVNSALGQLEEPLEVLLISPFRGLAVDEKCKLVVSDNWSLSGLINDGLKAANGDLVAFLMPGDFWEPHYLGRLIALARSRLNVHFFCCGFQWHRDRKSYRDPEQRNSIEDESTVSGLGVSNGEARQMQISAFAGYRWAIMRLGCFDERITGVRAERFLFDSRHVERLLFSSRIHCFVSEVGRLQEAPCFEPILKVAEVSENLNGVDLNGRKKGLFQFDDPFSLVWYNIRVGNLGVAKTLLRNPQCKESVMRSIVMKTLLGLRGCFPYKSR